MSRQLDTCIAYIENHCDKIVFHDLLDELLQYDHENRTPYDRTVAFMISLLSGIGVESIKKEVSRSVIPIKTFKISV
jgi:hypothetical protein